MDKKENSDFGTERRRTALNREDVFARLLEGIRDCAIYLIDPEGYIVSWNAGAERIKGYGPHEIIGKHFSEFYTSEDRATGIPQFALKTAAKLGKFEGEGWRVKKDGSRFWASVLLDAIREGDASSGLRRSLAT